ncbi:MAG: hypothetical protein IKR53_04450 [Clostridia bacterium]|nr:hypothetical protein [Clostridia bacterium]
MSKKVLAVLLATVIVASLMAVHTYAAAFNPAGGCKTEVTVKRAAPGAVVHDGIISPGEYNEIEINRNPETTDLLMSWEGAGALLESACEMLKTAHFYISWDENGINMAAQATLQEDPHCEGIFPTEFTEYEGKTFPSDEFFMFQFGGLFKIDDPEEGVNESVVYRSIGLNTETNEQLYGWYWDHGRTGALSQEAGRDYFVRVDGRTVTYEMTYPIETVFKSEDIKDSIPVDGTEFFFTISLTGGSQGVNHSDNQTYAVSLGDGGFMTSPRLISDFSGALGIISNETVTGEGPGETTAPTEPGTTEPGATEPGSTEPGATEPGNVVDPDNNNNTGNNDPTNPDPVQGPGTAQNPGVGSNAPATGDPMIVLAVVSVLGAGTALIIKKRRF